MQVIGLQTFIWENNLKSIILLAIFPLLILLEVFFILCALFLYAEGSENILANAFDGTLLLSPLVFFVILVWFVIAFFANKKITLSMAHAKPLNRTLNPRVYNLVENLCISRGLPVPAIYEIPDTSLNAFATGWDPKSAVIAFSTGIMQKLDDKELEAVAAHELTHIMNRDIRLMVVVIVFVGIITTIAEIFLRVRMHSSGSNRKGGGSALLIIILLKILIFVLAYFITLIIQLAISRKREFLADAGSVELTKNSQALISALQKISMDSSIEVINNRQFAQICIENPLAEVGHKSILDKLFSTHPPISERIQALRMMGGV